MKRTVKKKWYVCDKCDDGCAMYMPKKAAKEILSQNYCYMMAINPDTKMRGRWKVPKWAKTELTQ